MGQNPHTPAGACRFLEKFKELSQINVIGLSLYVRLPQNLVNVVPLYRRRTQQAAFRSKLGSAVVDPP